MTEQERREQAVTDQAVASFADASSPRFRELMEALVRHSHAFAREVRLTEEEWTAAIEFLTRCGHITTDKRQEFILLSDVLGLSMQTIGINHPANADATEATVFGPFFTEDAPRIAYGGDISQGEPGQPCWVSGTVRGVDGRAIAGARLDIWQADDDGFYDVQYNDERLSGRAHLFSEDDGGYGFWGITPPPYPIPQDGPVGALLTEGGRSPMRAAHLHFMVTAPGYRRLVTHIFVRGGDYLDSDAVFGVKESLIVDFAEQPEGTPVPGGRRVEGRWARADFDIVLAPEEE